MDYDAGVERAEGGGKRCLCGDFFCAPCVAAMAQVDPEGANGGEWVCADCFRRIIEREQREAVAK